MRAPPCTFVHRICRKRRRIKTLMTEVAQPPAALGGVRVLDMSRVLAGPWCGQILADLGAQVIKVERPGEGDDTRHWGPPFMQDAEGRDTRDATYYTCANRNKQSVTVDLTQPEGQAIVRELALKSDV